MKKFLLLLFLLLPSPVWASLTTNLVSYWPGNEASGNALDAVVASGNDLTDTNTVTNSAGKVYATARQYTAASSEYHARADNASLSVGGTAFTLTAWVYFDSVSATHSIFSKDNGATQREFRLYATAGNVMEFQTWTGASGAGSVLVADNTVTLTTGTWYFVMAKSDQTLNYISVNNNTPVTVSAVSAGWDGTSAFEIGRQAGVNLMNGRIGPVMFWKRALSAAEITQVYNFGAGVTYQAITAGIFPTVLTSGSSTTDGTVFTTASITPPANQLLTIDYLTGDGTLASPTVSCGGLTWDQIVNVNFNTIASPTKRLGLLRSMGASPSTGACTLTFPTTQSGCAWFIRAWEGTDTSGVRGSGAIVQIKTGGGNSGTSQSLTFANAWSSATNNAGHFVLGATITSAITPEAGWAGIGTASYTTPSMGMADAWRNGEDNTPSAIFASADRAMISVELKATGAPAIVPIALFDDEE